MPTACGSCRLYLGLPIAMVILSITAVPIFHRLKVFTAYEYLEGRFDLKTRSIAALLFLTQRGLAAGLTIYAPALVLSLILGWNLTYTNVAVGVMVIIYTTLGGTKAVSWTQFHQMLVITFGMAAAFVTAIVLLPEGVGMFDAATIAGTMGRLNAIELDFDPTSRYNIWSGLIGGLFLMLSYFGTDQSQVQRYLTGSSVAQSRIALLFNGLVKVPMQFLILFLGAMVFAFYQFVAPPIFFNPEEIAAIEESAYAEDFSRLESEYAAAHELKLTEVGDFLEARESGDPERVEAARASLLAADEEMTAVRGEAIDLMVANDPDTDPSDTNYVFLTFVVTYLPAGLVGLLIAAILFASMSSTSSELNALASTTVVDVYKRLFRKDASERHYVLVSKLATVFWGLYAIWFAEFASRLGTLVEAVNILGSLFYGTILGIFLMAFYSKRVGRYGGLPRCDPGRVGSRLVLQVHRDLVPLVQPDRRRTGGRARLPPAATDGSAWTSGRPSIGDLTGRPTYSSPSQSTSSASTRRTSKRRATSSSSPRPTRCGVRNSQTISPSGVISKARPRSVSVMSVLPLSSRWLVPQHSV